MTVRSASHGIAVAVVAISVATTAPLEKADCGDIEIEPLLREFTGDYTTSGSDSIDLTVTFDFMAAGAWHVTLEPGGEGELHTGPHPDAAFTLKMSPETLRRIHEGSITAFTAGAKGSGSDTAPLEMEIHEAAQRLPNAKETILDFLQHFFMVGRPERIVLREQNSRVVHGAHTIPLYYGEGFRSAWYKVKHGQRLNEPGDTNPYPQAFIIISGTGRAKIGETEVKVQAGESYYIPPDSDHVLWPDDGQEIVLIWLAWGEGA